jgi:hypothetical protein
MMLPPPVGAEGEISSGLAQIGLVMVSVEVQTVYDETKEFGA